MHQFSPIKIAQTLIRFDTTNPPGDEAACIAYIDQLLQSVGFETKLVSKDPARPNLLTRLEGRGEAPPLLIQGHVDVVTTEGQDWTHPPFEGLIKDGVLWGRGALDMKGAVATMISAMIQAKQDGVVPAGDIILCILADEENMANYGAQFLITEHPELFEGVRYSLGEFGGFPRTLAGQRFHMIQIAEKRGMRLFATVKGEAGHASNIVRDGAMADVGDLLTQLNKLEMPVHVTPAVRLMVDGLSENLSFPTNFIIKQLTNPTMARILFPLLRSQLGQLEPLFRNTVNPTIIRGGNKSNVIPSEIKLEFDVRLLPGISGDVFLKELKERLSTPAEFELKSWENLKDVGEPDMGLFPLLAEILIEADPTGVPIPYVLPAVSDSRFFAELGIQPYGFTPLKLPVEYDILRMVHAADERVPIDALEFGHDAYYQLIKRYRI